jgi:Transcription factor Tfb2/Transcription factor Tfb2 (p52) C-terminal domain
LHLQDLSHECKATEVVALHTFFRNSMQAALTSSEEVPWEEETRELPPLRASPSQFEIESFAASRWNALLHFLVGSPDAPVPDPKGIELLVATRLLAPGKAAEGTSTSSLLGAGDDLDEDGLGGSGSAESAAELQARLEKARARYGGQQSDGPAARTVSTRATAASSSSSGAGGAAPDGGKGAGEPTPSPTAAAMLPSSSSAGSASASSSKRLSYSDILALGNGNVHITRQGYVFLLKDTSVQLWTFMHEYLKAAAQGSANSTTSPTNADGEKRTTTKVTDILAFLFELGLCRLGEGYAVAALSPTQRALLSDFASFGLIYIPPNQQVKATEAVKKAAAEAKAKGQPLKREFRRFFPTSLAIILTQPDTTSSTLEQIMKSSAALAGASSAVSGGAIASLGDPSAGLGSLSADSALMALENGASSSSPSDSGNKLYLIVEKNFKCYAYTSIDLHLALLGLFCKIETRLPNLIVATLTRKSVITAMEKGISAAAIYHFLAVRAHPSVTSRGPPVPENVVDQLFLWERERHRVSYRAGVLLHSFDTIERFLACQAYVRDDLKALLWSNEKEKELVVAESHFEEAKLWLATAGGTAAGGAGGAGSASGTEVALTRRS